MGNTYQARGVIGNVGLPVSGGIIREEHLNNEFTNIIAAFNSGTGHSHNGTDSPRVTALGANGELGTSSNAITPGTATIDVGANGNKFRDGFYSGTVYGDTALQSPKIKDTNGRESIVIAATSTAVNHFTVTNAATSGDISISATGSDTNVSMALTPKGSGTVKIAQDKLSYGGATITTTSGELNLLDASTSSVGTTAVAGGDGIVTKDISGTAATRLTSLDTFDTYLSTTTKTLTNKTITTLVNGGAITIPTGTDTLVGRATTDTLTNKTLSSTNGINTGTGFVAIKNGGARSELRLYCESSNQHYLALQAPAHGTFGGNPTITFPTPPVNGSDTLVSKTSTDTLTNKTFNADNSASGNTLSNVAVTHLAGSALVTESEGIGSNDNDTTLPTSAAVKDYVDTQVGGISADIEGVTAGTGLSGGGTSGTVTLNIDTATTVDLSTAQTLTNKHLGVTSEEYLSIGNMGSSQSLNLDNDAVFLGTLNSATCTISFTENFGNTKAYGFTVILVQDGTGNRAITWPNTIRWADGGNAPSISTTANRYDVFTFITYDAGANYHGFHSATNQY